MMFEKWNSIAVAALIAVVCGCTSGGVGGRSRAEEMEEGYRAAKHGYWQEALMRYERAEQLEPGNAEVLNNLGVALEAVGRYEEAGEVYARARHIDPKDEKLKRNHRQYTDFYATYIEKKKLGDEMGKEKNDE